MMSAELSPESDERRDRVGDRGNRAALGFEHRAQLILRLLGASDSYLGAGHGDGSSLDEHFPDIKAAHAVQFLKVRLMPRHCSSRANCGTLEQDPPTLTTGRQPLDRE